jgi:hypothetical protein
MAANRHFGKHYSTVTSLHKTKVEIAKRRQKKPNEGRTSKTKAEKAIRKQKRKGSKSRMNAEQEEPKQKE